MICFSLTPTLSPQGEGERPASAKFGDHLLQARYNCSSPWGERVGVREPTRTENDFAKP
jgi:hypothetical protein